MCIRDRDVPEDSFLVGYADNFTAAILARDQELAQIRLYQVLRKVDKLMENHGLRLATEKTEIAMITKEKLIHFRPSVLLSKKPIPMKNG